MASTTEMQNRTQGPVDPLDHTTNGDIENQMKADELDKAEADSEGADTAVDSDPVANNDFPDLAPSKSMEFPDGGKDAWLCLAGGFLGLFCSFGFINAVGVFQNYYQENQLSDKTPFQIGWLSSFLLFFMNMGGIVIGPLFDMFGPRWLLIAATFFSSFGLMMTSLCTEYWQFFLAQGIVTGLGLSLTYFNLPLTAFDGLTLTGSKHKRGLAMGLMVSGSSLGGVIFPIMLDRLFGSVGFGWGVRAAGFLIFGLLFIANFLVKSRLPPPGWVKGRKLFDLTALKDPTFLLALFGCYFVYWGLFTPFTFLTTYAMSYGMDETLAFYLISIINAASVVGRIVPGVLADRAGVYNIQILFTLLVSIGVLAYWMPSTNNAAIITFALFYGFSSGAFISLFMVCVAMISPIKRLGERFGIVSAANGIASLTGIPISGALQLSGTWSNGFGPMILFSGLCAVIGCAFYTAARVHMVGWKLHVKR